MLKMTRELQDMTAVATDNEMQSLSGFPADHVWEVGIEDLALLHCDDPEEHARLPLAERGTIDPQLLSEYPGFHQMPIFPKHLLNMIYTSTVNNNAPWIFGRATTISFTNMWDTNSKMNFARIPEFHL